MKTVLERASAYLSRMPVSVSRQGGHTAAFRAAVALVRGFDLPEQEALPLLCRWNEGCRPPWRENVLRQNCAAPPPLPPARRVTCWRHHSPPETGNLSPPLPHGLETVGRRAGRGHRGRRDRIQPALPP